MAIRPEDKGVTWAEAEEAMRTLPAFVREAGLWTTVPERWPVSEELIAAVRSGVLETFAAWEVRS